MKTEVKTVLGIRDEEVLLGDATGAVQPYSFDAFDFPPVFGDKVVVISFDNGSVRVIREGDGATSNATATPPASVPNQEPVAMPQEVNDGYMAPPPPSAPASMNPSPAAAAEAPAVPADYGGMQDAEPDASASASYAAPPSGARVLSKKSLAFLLAIAALVIGSAYKGKVAAPCSTEVDERATTPLMYSALAGDDRNVRCLLDNGADVNAANKGGSTALMFAALFDRPRIARLLIDRGADVNATDKGGKAALMFAVEGSSSWFSSKTARVLIEKGANVNATDKGGKSAIQIAKEKKSWETVQMLKAAGAKE